MPVITPTAACPYCQSEHLIRYGKTPDERQRYRCRACGQRRRDDPRPNGYAEDERELILRAYQERTSLRGLERIFGVSRHTVSTWVKKKPRCSHP